MTNTYTLGISGGYHDGAVSLVSDQGDIIFAAHSERYSKIKGDPGISSDLLQEIKNYPIHRVAFYERPWLHNVQQWISGQKNYAAWRTRNRVCELLGPHDWGDVTPSFCNFPHHLSHAAAAFQTSSFDSSAVVVIDAIGELDTISIFRAWYDDQGRAQYQRLWRQLYPHSIGLFYSAVTQRIGLRAMEEEYITMGMVAYSQDLGRGSETHMTRDLVAHINDCRFSENLHAGINHDYYQEDPCDMAAGAQNIAEKMISAVMWRARALTGETNLCYGGGVALNCVANRRLGDVFDRIWIMPNPGDAGAALGAAALSTGRRLCWRDAFLGHNIPGDYPVNHALDHLLEKGLVGVASGRAEWGPRALGNRSLLADPRGADIKDRVNEIKRRQKFRPFAPMILAELTDQYFAMPVGWSRSDYMQTVATCRRPDLYPAICHVDGTSRVQTVPCDGSGIRQLLEKWFMVTGCPMLLNTSLNIRGEPMVNDLDDAQRFQNLYDITVVTP
jgi:carbamoyltransferase